MDADWIKFHPNPTKPQFKPPAGAVDAHCHVFGPSAQFPFAAQRKYTPCDASKDQLFALRDYLGFTRNVVVQATCHGSDNRATIDAVQAANGHARGVVTLSPDVTDVQLRAMHAAGIRGARFNFVKRLVDITPKQVLVDLANRIAPLGWHVVVYFEAQDLPEFWDFFTALPTIVVVDHMGRPDVSESIDGPEFSLFMRLMREHSNVWSKVSCPDRLSRQAPHQFSDVVPFAKRIVETFPNRVLWGTDWPHPNMKVYAPDDGLLTDFIPQIATTTQLQQKLLVDNPMRLYWGEPSEGSS